MLTPDMLREAVKNLEFNNFPTFEDHREWCKKYNQKWYEWLKEHGYA